MTLKLMCNYMSRRTFDSFIWQCSKCYWPLFCRVTVSSRVQFTVQKHLFQPEIEYF